jgi:hypothetical protein
LETLRQAVDAAHDDVRPESAPVEARARTAPSETIDRGSTSILGRLK